MEENLEFATKLGVAIMNMLRYTNIYSRSAEKSNIQGDKRRKEEYEAHVITMRKALEYLGFNTVPDKKYIDEDDKYSQISYMHYKLDC